MDLIAFCMPKLSGKELAKSGFCVAKKAPDFVKIN
jgi:hypothetical protein